MQIWFAGLGPVGQALLASVMTWFVTLLGAALVFFFRRVSAGVMDALMGAAGGVMLAASCWSLLQPALMRAGEMGMNPLFCVLPGFLAGGLVVCLGDMVFSGGMGRRGRLMFSITLHNIPEGMSVGIAFGAVMYGLEGATLAAAWMLALGIALQNFPEGAAVSLPLRREGMSRRRAFFYGQMSGMAEPLAAVMGAVMVTKVMGIMPFMLAFAAGAMVYVVVSDLIPESQRNRNGAVMSMVTMAGFAVMMMMDTMI